MSRIGAAVSASMNEIRSAGYSGSMGTYAAPALRIAYSETTISSERSMQTATREPGPARELDEVAGQPVRPAVQLPVRQGLVAEADRGRLRSPGHLRLERLVEESDRIVLGRGVPRRRRQLVGPQLRHPACPTGGASVPRNSGMSMPSPYRMPSRDSTAAAVPNRIETSIRRS